MPGPTRPPGRGRRAARSVAAVYRKAYVDNVTGLSGMVAYTMLLSVFPLALVALFVAGQVLESGELEARVLADLEELFPAATEETLEDALDDVQDSSTGIGIVALLTSVWIGSSFWGALDTAFCRIYHVECRSWVEQKRFALLMLLVVLLFIVATLAVPFAESVLVAGAEDLPFGLSELTGLVFALTLAAGLAVLFAVLCVIYRSVPNRPVPWRAVWPGAVLATLVIGAIDYAFSAYISSISTLARFGTTFVFVLIVLVWFYALALIILVGAIVNSLRFEARESR